MHKKDIQRNRVINYFKEAVTAIVEEEGLSSLSARKVGERAGYSYATIYNYFSDFKELLALVCLDVLEELALKMNKVYKTPIETIIESSKVYFNFFTDRPDWFKLIFIEDLGDHPQKLVQSKGDISASSLLFQQLQLCADQNSIKKESVSFYHEWITASIHGKILFFVYQRQQSNKEQIIKQIEKEIYFLVEG